ncbi:conserved hypothetical protein [Planktothrix serta PCC 8927]|uniref:Uncharacterized protein n=1 Tax=Planktothrix serta PCC 8927 TaxID=671068 RepID=A0A7Z9DXF3_9CYAN|nr:hypothetical protein [Planktothrix serta]VXD11096.1 conserved hypothetical protein [Planktothrix serta PCC 8927]
MKKDKSEMEDDLRTEYDLKSLRVRRLGSGRKSFGGITVRLEPDVAEIFASADAVNEALRFLIRVIRDNQAVASTAEANPSLKQIDPDRDKPKNNFS